MGLCINFFRLLNKRCIPSFDVRHIVLCNLANPGLFVSTATICVSFVNIGGARLLMLCGI